MKIHVEVDCTPEEVRRLMGLPDLAPIHQRYLEMMTDALSGTGAKPEAIEALVRSWAPMGEAGWAMWRQVMDGVTPK